MNFPTFWQTLLSPEAIVALITIPTAAFFLTLWLGPIGIVIGMLLGFAGGRLAAHLYFYRKGY